MLPDTVVTAYIPMVERMVAARWFTVRASACGTLATVLPLVPDDVQSRLVKAYQVLADDQVPMVRRSAAAALKDLVAVMPHSALFEVAYPLWVSLADDEQDNTRIQVAACLPAVGLTFVGEPAAWCCHCRLGMSAGCFQLTTVPLRRARPQFASVLEHEGQAAKLLPILHACGEDSSWRVRYMVSDVLVEVRSNSDATAFVWSHSWRRAPSLDSPPPTLLRPSTPRRPRSSRRRAVPVACALSCFPFSCD